MSAVLDLVAENCGDDGAAVHVDECGNDAGNDGRYDRSHDGGRETSRDASRDTTMVELDGPPAFDYGERVRSRFTVRNDGTFAGKDIGEILVRKGDVGYVSSIGTYLQQFYIYGIDFVERGYKVGMKRRELISLNRSADAGAPGVAAEPQR